MTYFRGGPRDSDLDRARRAGELAPETAADAADTAPDDPRAGAPGTNAMPGTPPVRVPPGLGWLARLAASVAGLAPSIPPVPRPGAPRAGDAAPDARRVGIVFVHGIGNQKPGETLLEWSGALLAALAAWRARVDADGTALTWETSGHAAGPWFADSVIRAQLDFNGSTLPLVEVGVPGVTGSPGAAARPQRWIMTEAWWAARVEPPSLSAVADWTGRDGVLGRVVVGILGNTGTGLRRLLAPGLALFISALGFLTLLGFQVLRAIAGIVPVSGIREALTARQLDTFLVDWWGDVYALLREPVQAANIRGTLADALRALTSYGCDALVVVAHSGGTIVSFTTLSDPAYLDLGVDTLITHGQAITLARTIVDTAPPPLGLALEDAPIGNLQTEPLGPRVEPHPLRGDPRARRWRDFYATHDPAPSGRLVDCPPPGSPDAPRASTQVANRMSVREDHGTYWTNDEEFVLPVLRELDVAGLSPSETRFPAVSADAVARRRQRVAVRSVWWRSALVMPLLALLAAVGYAAPGAGLAAPALVGDLGKGIAGALGGVIGADAIGGALTALREAILRNAPAVDAAAGPLAAFGMGAILASLLVYALAPVRAWRAFPSTAGKLLAAIPDVGMSVLVVAAFVLAAATLAGPFQSSDPAGWLNRAVTAPGFGLATVAGILAAPIAVGIYALLLPLWNRLVPRWPALDDIATAIAIVLLAIVVAAIGWSLVFDAGIQSWLLGMAGIAFAVQLVVRIGSSRWDVWDAHERTAVRVRPDAPQALGRLRMLVAAIVGFAVLLVVVDAVGRNDPARLVAAIATAVAFGAGLAITDVERGRPATG